VSSRATEGALVALAALALLSACDRSPLAPEGKAAVSLGWQRPDASPAAANEVPVFDQIVDTNPCTGEPVTITYMGTGTVHGASGNVIVQSRGDVVTSDGYTGTFNWTFVFNRGQAVHLRTHDAEVSDASGRRVIFPIGLTHTTWRGDQPVVHVEHTEGARCVGAGEE
jgi:hypothetical protein